jgi:hypothetical protein
MTTTITVRVTLIGGEPMLDSEALSILFGVRVEEVRELPIVGGVSTIPKAWVQRGRQRAREAMAHTGSDAMLDSLRYWARKDHSAELEVVYQ